MKSNRKIVIIGAGSLGVMTLDAILSTGEYMKENVFFIDDAKEKNEVIYGVPVLGGSNDISRLDKEGYEFIIAIANNNIRKSIAEENNLNYVNIIHPKSSVSKFAKLGKGNIILPNVTIDPESIILNHVIINKNTSIGHNVKMENFTQASPGCQLGGQIQECTFLGLGVTLLPNKKIGKNSIIGAGAVVTKDIPSNCTAVGAPAKPIKYHTN